MSYALEIINPFYAARNRRVPTIRTKPPASEPIRYARLPQSPLNASPVPHLTSLYHFDEPGPYGDRRYPGNCPGRLIKDLLLFFRSASVYDPMTGSGTCRDVCDELSIPCRSHDLKSGFDACDPKNYREHDRFEFCWLHPPYWRMKIYSADPRDLSTAPTLDAFLHGYSRLIENCKRILKPGGILAILMGDYCDRQLGFVPLTFHTKRFAFDHGLRQQCTDIVRFGHGATSNRKVYQRAFIPGLHDVCMIFEKAGEY
jgi:hypothetical protein